VVISFRAGSSTTVVSRSKKTRPVKKNSLNVTRNKTRKREKKSRSFFLSETGAPRSDNTDEISIRNRRFSQPLIFLRPFDYLGRRPMPENTPAVAAVASLLIFNQSFYWGFLNFLTGFPIFAFWFFLTTRDSKRTSRKLWSSLAGTSVLLYGSHALWFAAELVAYLHQPGQKGLGQNGPLAPLVPPPVRPDRLPLVSAFVGFPGDGRL
jgi:hypothetical protein